MDHLRTLVTRIDRHLDIPATKCPCSPNRDSRVDHCGSKTGPVFENDAVGTPVQEPPLACIRTAIVLTIRRDNAQQRLFRGMNTDLLEIFFERVVDGASTRIDASLTLCVSDV